MKFGLVITVIFFIVNFTSLHVLIPGIKYMRPGLLTTILLLPLVIRSIARVEWSNPIGKWRVFFLLAIIPGIFIGYGTGRARGSFITNFQDLIGSFLAICIFVQSVNALRKVNNVIILSSAGLALYVLVHGGQGPGMIIDENDVGLVLVMLLPFAYFNFAESTNTIKKTMLGFLLLALLLAIAATVSRGAMVGTLPTLLIIWLKSKRKVVSIVGIAILLALVVLWGPPALVNEFRSIGDTDEGTAGARRYFWDLSIEMFKKKPIFGVGARCWGNAVWSGLIELPRHVSNSTPHSVYFQLISELGLVGIVSWAGLIAKTLLTGNEIKNTASKYIATCAPDDDASEMKFMLMFTNSLLVGMMGGLICGVFLSFLFYPHLFTYMGFMQATHNIAKQKRDELAADINNNQYCTPS